jgi:biotin synthase
MTLAECANVITRAFNGDTVDVEALINAKSGRCPEDCSFCAQSSFYDTGITKYPLLPKEVIIENAKKAKEAGATGFCLVCAYREPPEKDFQQICETITEIRSKVADVEVNVSLGFMTPERARKLRDLGVKRYNHNLEAAESYFPKICKTHDFADRVNTAKIVKEAGLELCSGGIIGMGESDDDIITLAMTLRAMNIDSIPVNFLNSIPKTPFEQKRELTPQRCLKTLCLFRFVNPNKELRVAGGREVNLRSLQPLSLYPANSLFVNGYLTTPGQDATDAHQMIRDLGFELDQPAAI